MTRETRPPLPHGPVREVRIDYEYERAGAANLFIHFAPLVLSYILLAGKDACNATVLVKLRDIEAPKEDDGFEGAFLSS